MLQISRRIGQLNPEFPVYRYVICTQAWPLWRHYLAELKVMGRLLHKYFAAPIPIMKVSPPELKAASDGTAFPASLIHPPHIREHHLEDFALREQESRRAKDPDFAEFAIHQLEKSGLNQYAEAKLAENGLQPADHHGAEVF